MFVRRFGEAAAARNVPYLLCTPCPSPACPLGVHKGTLPILLPVLVKRQLIDILYLVDISTLYYPSERHGERGREQVRECMVGRETLGWFLLFYNIYIFSFLFLNAIFYQ